MKLTTVESLFDYVKKVSSQKRKKNPTFDGKLFWQPIKDILSTTTWKASKWKTQSIVKYKSIMILPEFYINGYGDQEIIETNHFLIQTVRIPNSEDTSLKKIIQIALNIGQYQGCTSKIIVNNNIHNFILKKDSITTLHNILQEDNITQLQKILES